MTPAQTAKHYGLKSLTQVMEITGVSLNTLTNWHRDKPALFRVVLVGCTAEVRAMNYYSLLNDVIELQKERDVLSKRVKDLEEAFVFIESECCDAELSGCIPPTIENEQIIINIKKVSKQALKSRG